MLAKDLFDHSGLQTVFSHENRALSMGQRPASWQSILARLLRVHNNDELRSIAGELHTSTDETVAALATQLESLRDCLKAREPTAQLLTRLVVLADRAFQQVHLSYLFYSPLLKDEEEFSCTLHRYAEALARLRNIQVVPPPAPTRRKTPTIQRGVCGLFRDSLSLLNGCAGRRIENMNTQLNTDVIAVQVREYSGGVPSELLEEFDFKPNGSGSDAGVLGTGERLDDFVEPLEVVCGNTVLVLASVPSDEH